MPVSKVWKPLYKIISITGCQVWHPLELYSIAGLPKRPETAINYKNQDVFVSSRVSYKNANVPGEKDLKQSWGIILSIQFAAWKLQWQQSPIGLGTDKGTETDVTKEKCLYFLRLYRTHLTGYRSFLNKENYKMANIWMYLHCQILFQVSIYVLAHFMYSFIH